MLVLVTILIWFPWIAWVFDSTHKNIKIACGQEPLVSETDAYADLQYTFMLNKNT